MCWHGRTQTYLHASLVFYLQMEKKVNECCIYEHGYECLACKCGFGMRTGLGWEQLALHVQLCVRGKVSRQQPDRFSQQRCQYDRCLQCLEVIHCPVLSHPLPDYTGSKQAKSQRTQRRKESWLDRLYHNKVKNIFINCKLRKNQVLRKRTAACVSMQQHCICC